MKTGLKWIMALGLLLAGTLAFAQTGPQNLDSRLKSLGVSEVQVSQVSDVITKTMTYARTQQAQIKVVRAQIELAMTAANPDVAAVNALIDKKLQLQGDLEKKMVAQAAQIHQIVGDQVFEKLRGAFMARFSGHPRNGMGPMHQPMME